MKKYFLCCLILISMSLSAIGQTMADVIKMKDGQSYQGKIIGQSSNASIRFKLFDGTIVSLQKENIESITEEQTDETFAPSANLNTKTKYSIGMDLDYKKKGYFGMVEFGSMINTKGGKGGGFNLALINGYRVVPQFCVGAGIGLGLCHSMFAPVFLHLRSDFLKKKCTPFVAFNVGYNIPFTKEKYPYESGFTCEPQFGIGLKFSNRYQLNLIFGYSINNCIYEGIIYSKDWWGNIIPTDYYTYKYKAQAFTVKVGFIW